MATKTKATDSVRYAKRQAKAALDRVRAQQRARREAKSKARRELMAWYDEKLTVLERGLVRYRVQYPGMLITELAEVTGSSHDTVARHLRRPAVQEAIRLAQRSAFEALQEEQLGAIEELGELRRNGKTEQTRLRAATIIVWPLIHRPVKDGEEDNALAQAIKHNWEEHQRQVRQLGPAAGAIEVTARPVAEGVGRDGHTVGDSGGRKGEAPREV